MTSQSEHMAQQPEGEGDDVIGFALNLQQQQALQTLAGSRQVRLSGRVMGGRLLIDFVACNAPFVACNAPFARR